MEMNAARRCDGEALYAILGALNIVFGAVWTCWRTLCTGNRSVYRPVRSPQRQNFQLCFSCSLLQSDMDRKETRTLRTYARSYSFPLIFLFCYCRLCCLFFLFFFSLQLKSHRRTNGDQRNCRASLSRWCWFITQVLFWGTSPIFRDNIPKNSYRSLRRRLNMAKRRIKKSLLF